MRAAIVVQLVLFAVLLLIACAFHICCSLPFAAMLMATGFLTGRDAFDIKKMRHDISNIQRRMRNADGF